MAVQIGTLRPIVARPTLYLPAWFGLAGVVTALLFSVLVLVGSSRVVSAGLAAAAVGRAAGGCVIETTYVPTEVSYAPVPALVCWDHDDNLQVLSPERVR
jgi:hypothetical protein